MKVSILYGKETLSTAGKKGYVLSVNVSGGKIVSYTCADENEKRFTIDADSVKSVKEKIVYVDGGKGAASLFDSASPCSTAKGRTSAD